MNSRQVRIDLLKTHPKYPFTFYNIDINEYVLANIFWISILKDNFNLENWIFNSMYMNFDNDSEISIPIIKIFNYDQKKILTIFHLNKYEENFNYPYFMIGVDMTEVDLADDEIDEFYELAISADLRHDNSLNYALEFIKKFIDDNISLEDMDILIEAFDEKHELELQRK